MLLVDSHQEEHSSRLTAQRERELLRRARGGDTAAQQELLAALEPLVYSIARRFVGPVELEDLAQEGRVGLLKAIPRFDEARGTRLTTYATAWIEGEIRAALRQSLIRLPAAKAARLGDLDRASQELRTKLGREASFAELAGATGLNEGAIEDMSRVLQPLVSYEQEGENRGESTVDIALLEQLLLGGSENAVAAMVDRYSELRSWVDEMPGLAAQLVELEDALARLADDDFRALETKAFYGLSFDEAGAWLGVHPNTVRNRYKAAIRALSRHLSGDERLPEPIRDLDWERQLDPVESIRLVVRRYQPFLEQLAVMAEDDETGFLTGLEVGWVLHEEEGWVPLLSKDIRETARWMRREPRSLSEALGDY
jgi:RNA polymerase sigma factor (sigma-70 family)